MHKIVHIHVHSDEQFNTQNGAHHIDVIARQCILLALCFKIKQPALALPSSAHYPVTQEGNGHVAGRKHLILAGESTAIPTARSSVDL